jgi:cysteinyl-tRNA synthetase
VYFRVAKDDDYGKLSGRRLEEMRDGVRLGVDERKEDAADFALWKAAKPGEPSWDSPWGKGRPGWHIECSAMNLQYLGEQIDIHGGGNDLIFPHHENEIAQTESVTGRPFARYWVHNGMLQLSGEKMSKSLGNLVTIEEFLRRYESDVFRMLILNANYRSPLTYTDEVVEQARRGLERLRAGLRPAYGNAAGNEEAQAVLADRVKDAQSAFERSMDDDFNTSAGLSHLFDLVRSINQARDAGVQQSGLQAAQELLHKLGGVLGLRLEESRSQAKEAAPFVDLLIEVRGELRRIKQWGLADKIRDRLTQEGVVLEDGPDGTNWRVH